VSAGDVFFLPLKEHPKLKPRFGIEPNNPDMAFLSCILFLNLLCQNKSFFSLWKRKNKRGTPTRQKNGEIVLMNINCAHVFSITN